MTIAKTRERHTLIPTIFFSTTMLKSSLLVALAAFVAPASAAFTYVPFILGSTSTETFSAGECKVRRKTIGSIVYKIIKQF